MRPAAAVVAAVMQPSGRRRRRRLVRLLTTVRLGTLLSMEVLSITALPAALRQEIMPIGLAELSFFGYRFN